MTIRIATCATLPEPDPDAAPLAEALASAGLAATVLAWDDPGAPWDAPGPTILRSTWNYARALDAFLAWCDRVAAAGPLFNPREVVRANVHKRYLLALAARGVPVVPTALVEAGAAAGDVALRGAVRALAEQDALDPARARLVIKPEVGAGSLGARTFALDAPGGAAAAARHLEALTATGAALVQPYLASVEGHGERSLVWIDGALSHAIRKHPRFAGDSERIDGPVPVAPAEAAVAEAALGELGPTLLYARVDLARDAADRPVVMELELVEPSLFFARGPGAAARYAAALRRRLG